MLLMTLGNVIFLTACKVCFTLCNCHKQKQIGHNLIKETIMWTKPAATEMRFGFEVTMYVCNR